MADMMTFPDTWEEFEEQYGFTDKKQIYTNGSRLIQSFRVKQWLDHLESEHKQADTPQTDCAWMYDSRRDYEYDKALDEWKDFEEFDDGEDGEADS